MGLAEAANLVINLKLNDQASKAIAGVRTNVSKLGANFAKIGPLARQGASTAVQNLKKIGLAAGAAAIGIGALALKSGLDSLAQLEDATTSVTGAIEQMGLKGKVTADQIAGWANDIESNVQAAFDDKDIVQATETLIRYGKLSPTAIKPAMEVMVDLAAKTGDVGSASDLMAKALAAPEKAAGKLARVGVILTDQQQKQIEKMVEAGDVAGAQSLLLDALAESTKGAAAASKGPYNDAINTLKDTWEDLTRALAIGFLPVIQEISDYLKGKLADPKFLDTVRGFGESLAGFLKDALDAAKKIPWDSIGDAMKLAGQGAKAAYDLFMGLPDWVKTAVLTGWGLNKLTGGALSGIVGELAKGLIKGVLGIQAMQVNIQAANVTTTGGVPGAGAAPGGGAPVGGILGGILGSAGIAAIVAMAADQIGRLPQLQTGLQESQTATTATGFKQALEDLVGGSSVSNFLAGPFLSKFEELTGLTAAVKAEQAATGQSVVGLDGTMKGVGDSLKNGATVVPGPGFTEYMHAQSGATNDIVGDLIRVNQHLDTNNNGQIQFRELMAGKLGINADELRALKIASGGWNATLAAKLGISNEKLQQLKGEAAGTTQAINSKNWTPKITVPVTVKSTFNVSARQVAQATVRYVTQSGRLGAGVT